MSEISSYKFCVEPQKVDFTLCAAIPAMAGVILDTAGLDAHGKGFGVDALNARNCSWVLSRMALELDRRPAQYDTYEVATWISDYGRVLSTRNFTLTDASGAEFGRAVTQWAMIDLTARTAVDLSGVGREHADAMIDRPSPTDKPRKILSINPTTYVEHRVVYSDIDFNRHMNTLRYIDLLFDAMPLELVASQRAVRLDIHFLRECRHGQLLTLGSEQRDDVWLFTINNGEQEAVRASVEWRS
ncbi:MAG: thioesterase [Alistipes sp.]